MAERLQPAVRGLQVARRGAAPGGQHYQLIFSIHHPAGVPVLVSCFPAPFLAFLQVRMQLGLGVRDAIIPDRAFNTRQSTNAFLGYEAVESVDYDPRWVGGWVVGRAGGWAGGWVGGWVGGRVGAMCRMHAWMHA